MKNIEDKTNKNCTGCGACYAVCPVGAIEFKINEEGFFQPFINFEKCVKCGKCKNVCYKFEEKFEDINKIINGKLYSAQSKEIETVKSCTSGGIAYEIAKYGIENGYKIFGTIYNYDKNKAEAIITEKMEDLEKIKGSKYIQSDSSEALRSLVQECKMNRDLKYMVFGTPCQIFGIEKLIKENNIKNEFVKIDLFCHGVPSYLVWKKYLNFLKEKENVQNIEKVVFRSKHISWHDFCIEIQHENGSYYRASEGSSFYKAFFDNILLNKSCFDCKCRKEYSTADIRLGDYWGKRYIENNDGISAVLILTETGKEIISNLDIKIIEETSVKECLKKQSTYDYKGIDIREKAFEKLKVMSLDDTIKNYRKLKGKKAQIKTYLKELTIIMPDSMRSKFRKMMNKF